MSDLQQLTDIFYTSEQIPFDDSSGFILMSDCHRGDGSSADDFNKNKSIYFEALTYYFKRNFTYIELGDGEELWENRKISEIVRVHSDIFWLISRFIKENRFYSLYGNHDIIKKNGKFLENSDYEYLSDAEKDYLQLFKNVKCHEGLVLRHMGTGDDIFLLHGHQVDFLNNQLWKLSRFLVKNVWKPLEMIGVNDPTSPAKNNQKKDRVERDLIEWIQKEHHMLIAGHTHRPMFPEPGQPPYFNDGSCVHPGCITGIEISQGNITLVKWCIKAGEELKTSRFVLAGPRKLSAYFIKNP